jgi:hypothetical protein
MSRYCYYCNQVIDHGTPCSVTDKTVSQVRHCPKMNQVTPKLRDLNKKQDE